MGVRMSGTRREPKVLPEARARERGAAVSDAAPAGLSLVRLLQLASPALPIGAYSYSQGLEWAVHAGSVRDAASAQRWIGDLLEHVLPRGDVALALRLLDTARARDWNEFLRWNAFVRATRETAELGAESEQTGHSLLRLLQDLALLDADVEALLPRVAPISLPAAYAIAANALAIGAEAALTAYVWSWLENQVLCAIKTVPLGQVAGQRMLLALGGRIPGTVARAQRTGDDDLANFAPGLALASARHETQYTRLFRS
ncbi:MAG: urease accessory UreF family protein [Betaproteobacteria bacterium]